MKTEKLKEARVKEIVQILTKLSSLGIPFDSTEVQELKQHFDRYIKDGECWSGTVSFLAYGRIAYVILPEKANKPVELTLRIANKMPI